VDERIEGIESRPLEERVSKILEVAGVTQVEAAQAAEIHRQTLQNWLHGDGADPKVSTLMKFFRALEERVDGLELKHVIGD